MEEGKLYDLFVAEHFPFCPAYNIHVHHVLMRKEEGIIRNEENQTCDKGVRLTPKAQSHLLKEFETSAEEENWDVFPIAEIEREMEDD
jgi:hypothetical protein